MRVKETSDDYRYFPEPDLPPLHLDPAWLDELRDGLPELPAARRERYQAVLGLSAYDAAVLVGRSGRAAPVRGDAGGGCRARRRSRSRTGSPATTCGCASRPTGPIDVDPAELAVLDRGSSATGRSRGRTRRRSSSCTSRSGDGRRGDRRCARLPPDLRRRSARRGRRRGARRQPGSGRRLPGGQGRRSSGSSSGRS